MPITNTFRDFDIKCELCGIWTQQGVNITSSYFRQMNCSKCGAIIVYRPVIKVEAGTVSGAYDSNAKPAKAPGAF